METSRRNWTTKLAAFMLLLAVLTMAGKCDPDDDDDDDVVETDDISVPTDEDITVTDEPGDVSVSDDDTGADETSDGPETELTATAVPEVQVQSWGTLPVESTLNLVGETSALADCPYAADPVIDVPVSLATSPRGASGFASIPGLASARMYFGDGAIEGDSFPVHTEVDGEPFTEQSHIEVSEVSSSGFVMDWRRYRVSGDVETVDPSGLECQEGLSVFFRPVDLALFQLMLDQPALDMEVGGVDNWSCSATSDSVGIAGTATELPPGSLVTVTLVISGEDGSSDPVEVEAVVQEDGTFLAPFDIDGVTGEVSISARHGVYSLGGNFFETCNS